MDGYSFILISLAVWRITHLFSSEDGPFGMIYWLRRKAGAGFFGNLLDCFYCLSLWIALPFAIWMGFGFSDVFLSWLALSGAACLLERMTEKRPEYIQPIYSDAGKNGPSKPEYPDLIRTPAPGSSEKEIIT